MLIGFASAAPFAIKDIELGMPPDAHPALEIEDHCRLLGFGTLLQCFSSKNLEIRTTIAGETCGVVSLYFANLAHHLEKADWKSFHITFVCEGYQSTFDNLKRALVGKFGAPDHVETSYVKTIPWLYWYDGDFELALWNPPLNSEDPPEVWVLVNDKGLKEEREKLELRMRNEDI